MYWMLIPGALLYVAGARPRLLVTANIHAVEYIGSYVARALAARLVSGYGTALHITGLLDRADVWLVPLLNPDGAARVWQRRGWSGLGGSRFTANGVDPNRNFPFVPISGRAGWNTARGLSVFRDVFQEHQKHLRYRPIPERSAAIVGQLDPFLLNAFGTVSVTVEVSRPGLHVLLPWNLFNFFWWANPARPQRWAENDVEATTHALAALLERTEGTACVPVAPLLARVQGSGLGGQADEQSPSPQARKPPSPRLRRWTAALSALLLTTAVSCSNPNDALEACPMKADINSAGRDTRPAAALRVMTLNMWGIRFVSANIEQRFDALAERLNADESIDVIGLQEVWADGPRKRLLQSVAKAFPHQVDFQGEHGRSGLAILSRHPFAGAPCFVPFRKTGKWWKPWTGEWLGGKGIGAVEIQSAAGVIWFFVTHLHACYAAGAPTACDDGDEYGSYRGHQLETVRATVNDIAGERPALIAGDFNFTARSKYYKALTSNGVYPPAAFDPAWQRVEEPGAPLARIDYLWVRPGKESTWQTVEVAGPLFTEPVALPDGRTAPLSDHCGISAIVRPGG